MSVQIRTLGSLAHLVYSILGAQVRYFNLMRLSIEFLLEVGIVDIFDRSEQSGCESTSRSLTFLCQLSLEPVNFRFLREPSRLVHK